MLQDSLGGNSKTLMFVQVGPSQMNCAESINSLTFASRAKSVALGKATKNRQALDKSGATNKASTTLAAANKLGDVTQRENTEPPKQKRIGAKRGAAAS